jgi:hypothetical protein
MPSAMWIKWRSAEKLTLGGTERLFVLFGNCGRIEKELPRIR